MNWFWDNILLKKEERTGMLVFVSLLFILILVKWYMVVLYVPERGNHNPELFASIEYGYIDLEDQKGKTITKSPKLKAENNRQTKIKKKKIPQAINPKELEIEEVKENPLFDFNPNSTSLDSLLLLGIGKYAANNITKYRAKGGKFKAAKDLQKIYGIDSVLFAKLYPFIKIDKSRLFAKTPDSKHKNATYFKPKLALKSIDINLADTTEFKKLKGIGTVYANRIVKFRNSLGGFFSIDQIEDVWGISDSLFMTIRPYLAIDSAPVEKRNINLIDKEALVKHPYIDWKKAKVILSYKKMHGDYQSMEDFEKMHGISDAFVDTLKQYFVAR